MDRPGSAGLVGKPALDKLSGMMVLCCRNHQLRRENAERDGGPENGRKATPLATEGHGRKDTIVPKAEAAMPPPPPTQKPEVIEGPVKAHD
jgi:hypothetical protein